MLLLSALLLGLAHGYSGTCRTIDPTRWSTGLTTFWGGAEQAQLQVDFDNDNKFQDFILNDETYILVHFLVNVDTLTLNPHYPTNQDCIQGTPTGQENTNGCLDCVCATCSCGYGFTEQKVLYMEVDDDESGRDISNGNPSNYFEFQLLNKQVGFFIIDTVDFVEVCQGVSPTVTGTTATNSPEDIAPVDDIVAELNPTYAAGNVHSLATWRRTMVLHFAVEGSTPVRENDYVLVSFDGEISILDFWSPFKEAVQVGDTVNENVWLFRFDADYNIVKSGGGGNWYGNMHLNFIGSNWQRPAVQWVCVVEDPSNKGGATTTTTVTSTTTVVTTTTTTTVAADPVKYPLSTGTCYSGNWTWWEQTDLVDDGIDQELYSNSVMRCQYQEIAAMRMMDTEDTDLTETFQVIEFDLAAGSGTCDNVNQDPSDLCHEYMVSFCCEDCCPILEVTADPTNPPDLIEYYENYPGMYKLQTDLFNDAITYRQVTGKDDSGNDVFGEGVIYYWEDVGWLLGANTFTYSYYSDGIGERCPQFAPKNWTNRVYGTELNVECIPVVPSCNDVECVENAFCVMTGWGPECMCIPGFTKYEDGSCLNTTTDAVLYDGLCTNGYEWGDWLNMDDPQNDGDWETLRMADMTQACINPKAVEAQRVDASDTTPMVAHISRELGFWCINNEQAGGQCVDYEVRFCCEKYAAGSDCTEDGYAWTNWLNQDIPFDFGDFETPTYWGEADVCASPIGVEAQPVAGTTGSTEITHIDANEGFWCINEENPTDCADFEARFCCPAVSDEPDEDGWYSVNEGECTDRTMSWSNWLNADDPAGEGDYETLAKFSRMDVCGNPTGVQARTKGNDTDAIHLNLESGFWCVNDENTDNGCNDYEVRFCCPRFRVGTCEGPQASWTGWYNDEWNKKNERLWVSNKQELELNQIYGDGGACKEPTGAEVRVRPTGSTSFQNTMHDYSLNLIQHLDLDGYRCYNDEQLDTAAGGKYKCVDMEIRFCCEQALVYGECDQDGYEWSDWLNDDDATGAGDYETLAKFSGKEACAAPIAAQAQATDDGSVEYTHIDTTIGFYCLNDEQSTGQCADFEVRYCCPKMQVGTCNVKGYEWTPYYNGDDATGTGDWEMLHNLEPNQACLNPMGAKVRDTQAGYYGTSDEVTHLTLEGFYCLNEEQPSGMPCADFEISFCCPTDETMTCETAEQEWCADNEWCLETRDGPVCKCGDDDFSVDPDSDDYTKYEDGECLANTNPYPAINGNYTIEYGSCTQYGHAWSSWFSVDTADAEGDFEILSSFDAHTICPNPTGLRAQAVDTGLGAWPVHADLDIGFWCVNSEQDGGQCEDFSIQVCCPVFATGDCPTGHNWTEWYNNDDNLESGDWEMRTDDMCAKPAALQVRTLDGSPLNNVIHMDNDVGFWCINEENMPEACADYQVSFCCPELDQGECTEYGHTWGSFLDADDPDGLGDFETLTTFTGYQVCDAPTGIIAQGINGTDSPDEMKRVSVSEGFVCVNDEFDTCSDFEVQWCCPKWGASANGDDHCMLKGYEWTPWMNEDSPVTGTGDWETIQSQSELKVCSNPTAIQAFPATAGATANTHIDVEIGFWCLNEENSADCADFEVRWCCPTYEDFECDDEGYEWTEWLDRDDPIGEGDYETRFSYPQGSVCEDPTAIQAQARTAGSTAFTHVDLAYGFWCDNSEQPNGAQCADFEVRYCCPKMKEVACDAEGYGWTVWLDRDDPIESGDWENKDGFPAYIVCKDPLAVEAAVVTGSDGSTAVTHLDNDQGFWCINDEQPKDEVCADFEVRFCCPIEYTNPCPKPEALVSPNSHIKYNPSTFACECVCDYGYTRDWSTGPPIDSSWSCENDEQTCIKMYAPDTHANAKAHCEAMTGRIVTVPNADYQQWLDNLDFMNVGYFVEAANVAFDRWGPGHPLDDAGYECQVVDTDGFWRSVECATHTHAYICQVDQEPITCVKDVDPCVPTKTECVSFQTCLNADGFLSNDATLGPFAGEPEKVESYQVSCSDPDAIPATNAGGVDGAIHCTCDGKSDCYWSSDDFLGELTEEEMCITDTTCPVSMFKTYTGELQFTRNSFINDPLHNTLQSDLYDFEMAEVLGRIETTALASFESADWDWSQGHYLVVVWPATLEANSIQSVYPYGDYVDPGFTSEWGDGAIQVWETHYNPLVLRDGSIRDITTQNIEVVLDIRHTKDIADIDELLVFRIAMVPKTWNDKYNDPQTTTVEELSNCLNHMLDDKAKFHPSLRRVGAVSAPKKDAKPANKGPSGKPNKKKWQKKKKVSKAEWAAKQAKRQARLNGQ